MMDDLMINPARTMPDTQPCRGKRSAFTLTEVLVVIGIIVLVMAMAVPAFNYVSGARSQEAASNVVSAMVARARNMAVSNARHTGVFFRLDPITDRTTLYIVERDAGAARDPDPMDRYKGWRQASSGTDVQYQINPYRDRALFLTVDERQQYVASTSPDPNDETSTTAVDANAFSVKNRVYTKVYRAKQDMNPSNAGANLPPDRGNGTFFNDFWEQVTEGDLDLAEGADSEAQSLPSGVGLQLINEFGGTNTYTGEDHYVRTGLILFDPQGRLEMVDSHIADTSALSRLLGIPTGTTMYLRSSPGFVMYDLSTFRGQVAPSGENFSDVDRSTTLLSGGQTTVSTSGDESKKETWLDDNANITLINRVSGALTEVK